MSGPVLDEALRPPARRPLLSRERWESLDRGHRVLLGLAVAVVALRVVLFPATAGTPAYGDEAYYLDAARALSNLVRDLVTLSAPDTAELSRNVAGSGWFMPGTSALLTPLFLVVPDAPIALVRGYLGLVSTGLLLLAVQVVRRHLGPVPAGALLVMPGLVPMYAQFGFTAYGDLVAGLVVVLLLTQALELVRRVQRGVDVTWRHGVHLGLLGIASVYFRSSVAVLVVGVLAVTLVAALIIAGSRWRGVVLAMLGAAVAFVALLAPWSAYVSHELGARVVTTTSVPTVLANTFGDPDAVCYGECDPGSSIWFSPLRYSREVARATGTSEVEVLGEMSSYARADVTPHSYAHDVLGNLARYLRNPAGFAQILESPTSPYPSAGPVAALTYLMVFPAFLVGLAMLLVVDRRDAFSQVQALLLKVAIGALLVQPFVHLGGSRYWTTLGPLLGLSAAALYAARRPAEVAAGGGAVLPWLTRLQAGLSAAVVLVAAGVVVLSL